MKNLIILIVSILAIASASLETYQQGNGLGFELEAMKDSPVGIVMKGSIDPLSELDTKVTAFLKLAKVYIPILETM